MAKEKVALRMEVLVHNKCSMGAGVGKSGSSSADNIINIMKDGVKTKDGKNIITHLDDNTKAIFRTDVG